MKRLLLMVTLVCLLFPLVGCEETEEGVDNNIDIIVRNVSEHYLWIRIDGSQRGRIENDGIGRTMWDNISPGVHVLEAFTNEAYTEFHCTVVTDLLEDDEDFTWYLLENDRYEGTKEGNC